MRRGSPPTFPGKVHGLRAWRFDARDLVLTGPYSEQGWRAGGEATVAVCSQGGRHAPPAPHCGCGVYGLHPHRARGWLSNTDPDQVVGIVEGWGTVEVHEDGFRAERGRPVALTMIGPPGRAGEVRRRLATLEALAERYGIPLLSLDRPGALVAHCKSENLGLAEGTVRGLLGIEPEVVEESEVAVVPSPTGVNVPPPAPPAPPAPPPEPPSTLERVGTVLRAVGWGLLMIPIALWYLFWGALAVMVALTVLGFDVDLWGGNPPPPGPPLPAASLEIEEERLIPAPGEVTYVAIVRNTSDQRAALGVTVAGTLRDGDGAVLNEIDPPRHFDSPASLMPGERGVLVDTVRIKDAYRGWADGVRELRTVPQVRKRVTVGPGAPRVSGGEAIVDTDRCVVLGRLRAQAPVEEAHVVLLGRNRKGLPTGAWWGRIGPLERGANTKALLAIPPKACAGESRPPQLELSAGLPRRAVARLAADPGR